MSFMVGVRKREWAQITLYSLIFSAAAYFISLKLFPLIFQYLNIKPGTDAFGIQAALNEVSNLGTELGGSKGKIAFHNVIKLIIIITPISASLGYVVGLLRKSEFFYKLSLKYANRTQNVDIWIDFHEKHNVGPHMVYLRDGNAYFGQILMASDTLVGGDRGIIIQQPFMYKQPNEAYWKNEQPAIIKMPGNVLVFADQISAISNNLHPKIIERLRQMQHEVKKNDRSSNRWWSRKKSAPLNGSERSDAPK